MRNDYGLFPQQRRDTAVWLAALGGMLIGAFLCLCGVAALTILLLSFDRMLP